MKNAKTVIFTQHGRNKKAQAVSLFALQNKLEKDKENFEALLKPLLEVESDKKMPKVEIYTGNHAFGLLQMKLIKLQPKSEDILVISARPKEWLNAMVETQKLSLFEKTRLKKQVIFKLSCFSELRGEVERNNREYFAGQPEKLKRQFKYVESEHSSPAQVQVWFDYIVMSILTHIPVFI